MLTFNKNIMKKIKIFFLLIATVLLVGCSRQDVPPIDTVRENSSGEQSEIIDEFPQSEAANQVTSTQLRNADGKNGNLCYVAISGTVYEIRNSSLWVDGIHTKSGGSARCGLDLTTEIRRAPHGVSILTTSPTVSVVGILVN